MSAIERPVRAQDRLPFRRPLPSLAVLSVTLVCGVAAHGAFLDLSSVTPGGTGVGSFAGSIGSIPVTGSIVSGTGTAGAFAFQAVSPPLGVGGFANSTIDGTSPQWSYSSIFTPSQPLGDRVGYGLIANTTARVQINFGSPVTNPVINVANLDSAIFNFSPTSGLNGLTLLSGNGGGGVLATDGLTIDSTARTVFDATSATAVGLAPSTTPPTTEGRSAYGSVQLLGTFSSIAFDVSPNSPFLGDGGSFTISAVPIPEPGSLALGAFGLALCTARRRCPKRCQEPIRYDRTTPPITAARHNSPRLFRGSSHAFLKLLLANRRAL